LLTRHSVLSPTSSFLTVRTPSSSTATASPTSSYMSMISCSLPPPAAHSAHQRQATLHAKKVLPATGYTTLHYTTQETTTCECFESVWGEESASSKFRIGDYKNWARCLHFGWFFRWYHGKGGPQHSYRSCPMCG
jgi:hypothetical protein